MRLGILTVNGYSHRKGPIEIVRDATARSSTMSFEIILEPSSQFLYDDVAALYDTAIYSEPLPALMDEVILYEEDDVTKYFGGFVTEIAYDRIDRRGVIFKCKAKDYTLLLQTTYGSGSYTTQSDRAIIQAEFAANLPEILTPDSTIEIIKSSIDSFEAADLALSEVLKRLTELTIGEFYVDPNKTLHYFTPVNNPAPFEFHDTDFLTAGKEPYAFTSVEERWTNPANRVIVKGGIVGGSEIIVTRNDTTSQTAYGRIFSAVIVDRNIKNTTVAQLRGDAVLAERANPQFYCTATFEADGLEPGMQVLVTNLGRNFTQKPFTVRRVSQKNVNPENTFYTAELGPPTEDLTTLLQRISRIAIDDPVFPEAVPPPGSVGETELADGAVTRLKIAAQAVDTAQIEVDAIKESVIATGAITETKIGLDAITSPKIAAGAIVAGKLAAGAVTAGTIAANVITGAEIQAGSITAADAVFAIAAIGSADIASAAITNAKIANLAVDNAKIANLAVDNAKIANATITSAKIVNLDANKINAGTITGVNVSAGTYSLTSSPNTMVINGSEGFRQTNTSSGNNIQLINGELRLQSGSGTRALLQVGANGGALTVYNSSGAARGSLSVSTTEGRVTLINGSNTASSVFSGGTNNGFIDLRNSSNAPEVTIICNAVSNGGDSIVIANTSGSSRISMGVVGSQANSRISMSGNSAIVIDTTSGGSLGISIGGLRVLTSRQTDPGASPTTEQLRQVLLAHGLI